MKSKNTFKGATDSEQINSIIVKNLTEFVKKARLSQKELAETLNVSEATVSRILSGSSRLSIEKMMLLRKKYGVELDYFLSEPGTRKKSSPRYTMKSSEPMAESSFEQCLDIIKEDLNGSYGTDEFDEKMICLAKLFLKFTGVRGL